MKRRRPAALTPLWKRRERRTRERLGPAAVIPFRAVTPTSRAREPGVTPRTSAAGLSITLSVDIDEVLDALVEAEARRPRSTPNGKILPHDAPATPPRADTPAVPAVDVLSHLYACDADAAARFQCDVQTHARFLLRSRAGAIVRAVVSRTTALKGLADLATYRTIMGAGTWVWLLEAVRATRSYQAGLDLALLLLRVIEVHQSHLSHGEWTTHRQQLYWFILDMLDRLDQWEPYLATWERLRAHTAETVTVQPCARHEPGLAPFILGEDARGLRVHCLWPLLHRKELIERKVARQRRGQKLGNVTCQPGRSLDGRPERPSGVGGAARAGRLAAERLVTGDVVPTCALVLHNLRTRAHPSYVLIYINSVGDWFR